MVRSTRPAVAWRWFATRVSIAACVGLIPATSALGREPEEPIPGMYPYTAAGEESEMVEMEGYLPAPVTLADLLPAGARPRPFLLGGRVEHQFQTDIDGAGAFSVTRGVGAGAVMFPLGQRIGGLVGGSYGYANYDFDDAAAFGGDEAWGNIETVHFGGLVKYLVDRNWSLIGGGFGAFSGESGMDTSSSFVGGVTVGGGYRASEKFYVQLGLAAYSRLEDEPTVLPAFRLNWEIDDHWLFRAGVLETGATDTVGVGLIYRIDEEWSVAGRVGYVGRRFRLDDDGFAPEGVGEDKQFRGALSVIWEPNENLQCVVFGGMTFMGSVRVEDEEGRRLFREDYDSGPFVGVRLGLRF